MSNIPNPPVELIDPDGEGIYLLNEEPGVLLRAAALCGCSWQEVQHRTVWMRPSKDGMEWLPTGIGKFPHGWRLNLPRRWRPVAYAYCTPRADQESGER